MKRVNNDERNDNKKFKEEILEERKGCSSAVIRCDSKNRNHLIGWKSDLIPMTCEIPKWNSNQNTTISPNSDDQAIKLDEKGNYLFFKSNVLTETQIANFLAKEKTQERTQVPFMNNMTPRFEINYGDQYNYSGVVRPGIPHPEHIHELLEILKPTINSMIKEATNLDNPYTTLSNGISILYGPEAKINGGALCMHKDNESLPGFHWGLIIIYSVGQTRWLRVKRDSDNQYYNIPTVDNSLIMMFGPTFQKPSPDGYTHGIAQLSPKDNVGARLSLNIRFR